MFFIGILTLLYIEDGTINQEFKQGTNRKQGGIQTYVFTLAACAEVLNQEHGLPINAHAPAPSGREPVLQGCAEVLIQEHGLPINAHAPAPSGREPVLQGCTEVLIQEHGLVIPARLVLRLLLKPKNKKYKKYIFFKLFNYRRRQNINTLVKS